MCLRDRHELWRRAEAGSSDDSFFYGTTAKLKKKKKRGRVCEWGCNKLHAPLEMCFLETRVTRNETNQMGNLG